MISSFYTLRCTEKKKEHILEAEACNLIFVSFETTARREWEDQEGALPSPAFLARFVRFHRKGEGQVTGQENGSTLTRSTMGGSALRVLVPFARAAYMPYTCLSLRFLQ